MASLAFACKAWPSSSRTLFSVCACLSISRVVEILLIRKKHLGLSLSLVLANSFGNSGSLGNWAVQELVAEIFHVLGSTLADVVFHLGGLSSFELLSLLQSSLKLRVVVVNHLGNLGLPDVGDGVNLFAHLARHRALELLELE